ncbi:MAG: nucleotidyltransferase family protein [Anaerolineaceae bacterium]|jgi:GTP:adenosylcobinamide-phosphate guanylyltransferase|nr:nucleotidyltransferase family protein [Anaerolineaceae bacterium]
MDAIVTAGGMPTPDDPLATRLKNAPKSMMDVAGKPMIQWVLDALAGAKGIGRVVVVGLPEDAPLNFPRPLTILPDTGSMIDNLQSGAKALAPFHTANDFILAVSSDTPTITSAHVDWVVKQVEKTPDELFFGVIEREVMEKRFPGANRTYLKLKNIEVCASDFNALRINLISGGHPLAEQIVSARKNPLKQAMLLGVDTLLAVLFRRVTLDQTARRICRKLGITGRAVIVPFAELGMDVDKPHQLELVESDLAVQV